MTFLKIYILKAYFCLGIILLLLEEGTIFYISK